MVEQLLTLGYGSVTGSNSGLARKPTIGKLYYSSKWVHFPTEGRIKQEYDRDRSRLSYAILKVQRASNPHTAATVTRILESSVCFSNGIHFNMTEKG